MRRIIVAVYDAAQLVLCALCLFWAAYAAYLIVAAPDLAQRANTQLDEEMNRQDLDFCTKFGPPKNTHEHVLCTMELKRLRDSDRERLSGEGLW